MFDTGELEAAVDVLLRSGFIGPGRWAAVARSGSTASGSFEALDLAELGQRTIVVSEYIRAGGFQRPVATVLLDAEGEVATVLMRDDAPAAIIRT